jgi:hypothetical protein
VSLSNRLDKLERVTPPVCPACADRRGLVVLATVGPGGRTDNTPPPPPPCELCGETPEQIIEIEEVVVEAAKT